MIGPALLYRVMLRLSAATRSLTPGRPPANRDEHARLAPTDRGFIGSSGRPGLPSVVEGAALQLRSAFTACKTLASAARPLCRHAPPAAHGSPPAAARSRSHTLNKGGSPYAIAAAMAPPPGQTNRDTSAADHTTCFYCHQQLILVSHKVIVSRDAHGCSIRICEPCEKEARRRRPVRLPFLRSRRRRTGTRSLPPHRSRSRRKMRVLRPCASSWAAPQTRRRRRGVTNQLCLNLTRLLADEVADARKLLSN